MTPSLVYRYRGNTYINLTNTCSATCVFCIKFTWGMRYRGYNLRLPGDPSAAEVIAEFDRRAAGFRAGSKEVVFCGYGDAFLRVESLREVARHLKSRGHRVRVNTLGHANLVYGRNVVPEVAGLVDAVSVSLNAHNPQVYDRYIHHRFGPGAFQAVLDFIRCAKAVIPQVTVTAVRLPGVDIARCRRIVKEDLGVAFRARPYLKPRPGVSFPIRPGQVAITS